MRKGVEILQTARDFQYTEKIGESYYRCEREVWEVLIDVDRMISGGK
jgi:hypothetical protein